MKKLLFTLSILFVFTSTVLAGDSGEERLQRQYQLQDS